MEGDGGEMAVLSGFPCLGRGRKINTEGRCWELSRPPVLKWILGTSIFLVTGADSLLSSGFSQCSP